MADGPKLFVGLGNPGPSYARHRHNIGFMAVDSIAWRHRLPPWRRKFQGEVTEGELADVRVLLLKPMTFMNLSGQSVGEAMRFFKIPLADIVVLHDELDLVPGKVRVKQGGGVAGHNGLKSLAAHLGSPDFKRVRLGIGHPGHKDRVIGHVLSDFHKAETEWLEPLLDALADAAPLLAAGDDAGFMNRVALAVRPPAKDA
jgi:peptidyl-tRNA hydrolase, PTH1 family